MSEPYISISSGPIYNHFGQNESETGLFAISGFKIPFLPEPLNLENFTNLLENDYIHHLEQQIRFIRMLYPQPDIIDGLPLLEKTSVELRFVSQESDTDIAFGRQIDLYILGRTAYSIKQDTPELRSDIKKEAILLHKHIEQTFPIEYSLQSLVEKDWGDVNPILLQKINAQNTVEIRKYVEQDIAFRLNWTHNTLAQLCKALTQIESTVVLSISLHPTSPLDDDEKYFLQEHSIESPLLNINKFIPEIGINSDYIKDITKKRLSNHAQTADYYLQSWHHPFLFRVQVVSDKRIPSGLLQVIGEEISPTIDKEEINLAQGAFQPYQVAYPETPSDLNDAIYNYQYICRKPWGDNNINLEKFLRLRYMVGAIEANSAFRIPLVSPYGLSGIETVPFNPFAVHKKIKPTTEKEIVKLGKDVHGTDFSIPISSLSRHALIIGATGSGKTTTCQKILIELWDKGIPFLVIEPVKAEYRRFLHRSEFTKNPEKSILFFTVGDLASPLKFNPFEIPPGVSVGVYISALKSCFTAAFPLEGPLPIILEKAIREVYKKFNWNLDDIANIGHEKSFPTLNDLCKNMEHVINGLGYDSEFKQNAEAALSLRLANLRDGLLGQSLFLERSNTWSWRELLERPVVIELDSVVDDDEKALLISFIFTIISFYKKFEYENRETTEFQGVTHLTLIEEAHRLFSNTSQQNSTEVVTSKVKAINVFTDMLSEMRALGEGILIADQIPTKLAIDIIKHPDLKIMHRITSNEDRQVLGSAMNFSDNHTKYITTLKRGWAASYIEGLYTPTLVNIDSPQYLSSQNISKKLLMEYMAFLNLFNIIKNKNNYAQLAVEYCIKLMDRINTLDRTDKIKQINQIQNILKNIMKHDSELESKCNELTTSLEKEMFDERNKKA